MEKYAWRAKIVDGTIEEYKRRHAELWPEMAAVLKEAGIVNYTIWFHNNELFGYYECVNGIQYAARVQRDSPVVEKWDKFMGDILIMEKDPVTGAQPQLEKVFEMN